MGKLGDKAKAKAREKFPNTAKAIKTAGKIKNAVSSVMNGQCGNCGTALKNGTRCDKGCWD